MSSDASAAWSPGPLIHCAGAKLHVLHRHRVQALATFRMCPPSGLLLGAVKHTWLRAESWSRAKADVQHLHNGQLRACVCVVEVRPRRHVLGGRQTRSTGTMEYRETRDAEKM